MENQRIVDQRRASVNRFLAEHRDDLARQGSIVSSWRQRGSRRLGPYFRVVVRNREAQQVSVYLGNDAALIADVRRQIDDWRQALRQQRQLAKVRRALTEQLNVARRAFDEDLRSYGLYCKGAEIRGWRQPGAGKNDLLSTAP